MLQKFPTHHTRILRLLTVVAAAAAPALGTAAGVERELEPPTMVKTVEGVYEIRRSGDDVGTETFIRRVLSDNTVVVECTYDVAADDGTFVTGNNRLEYEEDSGFPRRYYTLRKTQSANSERVREATAEMYANVVVWDSHTGGNDVHKVMELPTGCLFIEANIANQIAAVVDRYKSSRGGKQSYRAFDPLAGGQAAVTVELIGEADPGDQETDVGKGPLAHYRYSAGEMSEADVFVDSEGLIVKVDVRTHDLQYVLVSAESRNGAGSK